VTLTPEQREALNTAVINGGYPVRRESIFLAGLRYAYEDAARIFDETGNGAFDFAKTIRSRIPKDSAIEGKRP